MAHVDWRWSCSPSAELALPLAEGTLMELAQIRLLVADFTSCYRFYRDVLGMKPQFDAEDDPYAHRRRRRRRRRPG